MSCSSSGSGGCSGGFAGDVDAGLGGLLCVLLGSSYLGKLIFDSFHCVLLTQLAPPDGRRLAAFVSEVRVAVGYGVALDAAFHMVVQPQGVDNIAQRFVVRVADLVPDDLPQFVLEGFLAAGFHLAFRKGFLVADLLEVFLVEILPDGMGQPAFHALLSEEFGHFVEVAFVAPERFAGVDVTVADQEMDVLVRLVRMYGEQHLEPFEKSLGKLLGDAEHFRIGQPGVVLRRE